MHKNAFEEALEAYVSASQACIQSLKDLQESYKERIALNQAFLKDIQGFKTALLEPSYCVRCENTLEIGTFKNSINGYGDVGEQAGLIPCPDCCPAFEEGVAA